MFYHKQMEKMVQWTAVWPSPGSSSGQSFPWGCLSVDCWAKHVLWDGRNAELTLFLFELMSVTGASGMGLEGVTGLEDSLGSLFLLSLPQGHTARAGTCGWWVLTHLLDASFFPWAEPLDGREGCPWAAFHLWSA